VKLRLVDNKEKILTKIEQQAGNKKRYSIYIDGEYTFGISEDVLVKHSLRKGQVLTQDILKDINHEEEQSKANSYGLRLLSFRNRSEQELVQKMKQKQYDVEVIKNTIAFLKHHQYINDEAFTNDFVKSKLSTQKYGKNRIKQELYQKGISKDLINSTIDEMSNSDQEYETALELSRKKLLTSYRNDDTQSQYRKIGGFLQRRGFGFETISKVLNKLL